MLSTSDMIRRLESLDDAGELTAEESEILRPLADLMHLGQVIRLTAEQIDQLDALHMSYFVRAA